MKYLVFLVPFVLSALAATVEEQLLALRSDTKTIIPSACEVRRTHASSWSKRSSHGDSGFTTSSTKTVEVIHSFSEWEQFCLVSGGNIDFLDDLSFLDDLTKRTSHERPEERRCINWAGFDGVNALYEFADPCEQQDNADRMITFAKKEGGSKRRTRIEQAIQYRKFPRRATRVLGLYPASPYCQKRPTNYELFGVWNSQLDGVNYGVYGGPKYPLITFGSEGSCPWGQRADIKSCRCIDDRPRPDKEYTQNCASTCRSKYPLSNTLSSSFPSTTRESVSESTFASTSSSSFATTTTTESEAGSTLATSSSSSFASTSTTGSETSFATSSFSSSVTESSSLPEPTRASDVQAYCTSTCQSKYPKL